MVKPISSVAISHERAVATPKLQNAKASDHICTAKVLVAGKLPARGRISPDFWNEEITEPTKLISKRGDRYESVIWRKRMNQPAPSISAAS